MSGVDLGREFFGLSHRTVLVMDERTGCENMLMLI